jgi:protein SCO1/2
MSSGNAVFCFINSVPNHNVARLFMRAGRRLRNQWYKMKQLLYLTFLPLLLFLYSTEVTAAETSQPAGKKYKRSVEHYTIPDVVLINQDGKKVRLASLLNSDQPVVVDFIYGTCTTICPVLSAGYANLQGKLARSAQLPRLISITIDPENDTPYIMKEYLKRFRARPGWEFLTGSRADIDAVMKGFNAYIPDKMSHYPLNLIRVPKEGHWVRLFGIMSSREFLDEYTECIKQ